MLRRMVPGARRLVDKVRDCRGAVAEEGPVAAIEVRGLAGGVQRVARRGQVAGQVRDENSGIRSVAGSHHS